MADNGEQFRPLVHDAIVVCKPGDDDCWSRIGVSGDRTCPELNSHIHCRNCPVFATAARTFFDRPAPEGYLSGWSRWLNGSVGQNAGEEVVQAEIDCQSQEERVSVLIFRLGAESLA